MLENILGLVELVYLKLNRVFKQKPTNQFIAKVLLFQRLNFKKLNELSMNNNVLL